MRKKNCYLLRKFLIRFFRIRFSPFRFYHFWKKGVSRESDLLTLIAATVNRSKSFVLLESKDWILISWFKFFWMQLQVWFLRRGKPLSYILKEHPFFSSSYLVNSHVLIPRVETEFFVEMIVKSHFVKKGNLILDIGTGSGVLAIELAKNIGCQVVSIDVCTKALKIAQKNRDRILKDHTYLVDIERGDIFIWRSFQKFSTIISNPPYIPTKEIQMLETSVRCWEPTVALDGGKSGTKIFEEIFRRLPELLEEQGNLLLEFSPEQAVFLEEISRPYFNNILIQEDQFFRPRFLIATGYRVL